MRMKRYYYAGNVCDFLLEDFYSVFGKLTSEDAFEADDLQKNTWKEEINILKRELRGFSDGTLLLEYTIPRVGARVDGVLLYEGIVFLLEFKVGERTYPRAALEQVTDYALDLRCFHRESRNAFLVPLLICTQAPERQIQLGMLDEQALLPLCCNEHNLGKTIRTVARSYRREALSAQAWADSVYAPTPTIIEAARALYRGHDVRDISRSDAGAANLSQTTDAVNRIIERSKTSGRKAICFVTGVPGAGKTLAGLNLSVERQHADMDEHAVFLSGNFPLVAVLQEALARDQSEREHIRKTAAQRKVKSFIQIIHRFRDEAVLSDTPPCERVAIFDEAQRAWTREQLAHFMERKKGVRDFRQSEPEFLIRYMDRHPDWAVIVCLVGGGQEINTGEAGLAAWFDALREHFPHWDVYISDRITDSEYTGGAAVAELIGTADIVPELHLAVSLRSFRSERVADFVKALLDCEDMRARSLYTAFRKDYPIVLTRELACAKDWVRQKAKGSQSYGLTASSGALRLRPYGVWVENKIDAPVWFLNGREDVRAARYLEEAATEFDIQGLELDWSVVCWDANLRHDGTEFQYHRFQGSAWQNIRDPTRRAYLKNAYRVLLTRARQGFVIFIPRGSLADPTCLPQFYDGIYRYLKKIGIEEI